MRTAVDATDGAFSDPAGPGPSRPPAPAADGRAPARRWPARVGCALALLLAALVACRPMVPAGIPTHPWSDMTNHVREVYEFTLALKERQVPPLVAPQQNWAMRGPQFQYYSFTAFVLPGALARAGLDPYRALGLAMFVQALAAGLFFYRTGRALRLGRAASLAAGVAFQLFPFAGIDLYRRGGYPEVAAMWAMPVVFYCLLRLVQSRGAAAVQYFCFAALAWAYFIPIHPLHSVMGACLFLFLLAGYVWLDRPGTWRQKWPMLLTPAASMAAGLLATIWFWYPIARDYGDLRVVGHQALFDAAIMNAWVLLWPFYHEPQANEWPAQLGAHLVAAALLALLLGRRTGALGVLAAVSFAGMVGIILWHDQIPHVNALLKPLQWTYRLKIPAAFAGALCLALSLAALERRLRSPWAGGFACGLTLAYVVMLAPPYFAHLPKYERHPLEVAVQPSYHHPNALAYAMRGTDFGELRRLWAPDGLLRLGADLPVAPEGYPFEARLLVRSETPGAPPPAGAGDVRVVIDGVTDRGVTKSPAGDGMLRLVVPFKPRVGLLPGDQLVRFEAAPGSAWRVADATFWTQGDPPDAEVRPAEAPVARRVQRRKRTLFHADVPPGREGLYQFPVCYLPSNALTVNGRPANLASVDKYLTIVRLPAGKSLVEVRTRPTQWAWWLSAATMVLAAAGAVGAGVARRRAPAVNGNK